jgi:Cof subfamily protein (haloacid dehalogenase superfamily)
MPDPAASPKPAPPRPRLLLADVDGTLVTKEKILTDRARDVVRRLKDAGIAFAITSGRPPRGMAMLTQPLALTTPIAAFNGGLYVKEDMQIIDQRVLGRDVVEPVIKIIEDHHLDVWIYRGNDWFVHERHGAHVDREEWTVKFPPTVVSSYDDKMDGVAKIVGVSDDLDAVAKCESAVRAAFGQQAGTQQSSPHRDSHGHPAVSAARSQPYYLDVTHPDANKGGVVLTLAKMLGLRPEEIATIGDMANDVPMFEKGGLSIAMGQASDEVKKAANEVTTSSEDEGFANAVERFILQAG